MVVVMNQCAVMARVRDALVDNVKAIMIKEKVNTYLLYIEIFTS